MCGFNYDEKAKSEERFGDIMGRGHMFGLPLPADPFIGKLIKKKNDWQRENPEKWDFLGIFDGVERKQARERKATILSAQQAQKDINAKYGTSGTTSILGG